MFDRILVPLDFGPRSDQALSVAEAFARRFGARLVGVMVIGPGLSPSDEKAKAEARAELVGCPLDGVDVRTGGDVSSGVLSASAAAGTLLCLATHTDGALARPVLHSVSDQVLRRTTRPVLAVGPQVVTDPPPRFDRVVACVDDVVLARRALAVVVAWATALDTDPCLIQVVGSGADPSSVEPADPAAARRLAEDLGERGIASSVHLLPDGDPADGILRFAEKLSGPVIVIASHGRSSLRRVALGTVAMEVTRRSAHPLLVVPAGPFLGVE